MLKSDAWLPSASIEVIHHRAIIIKTIRDFFNERDVVEVETPLLCRSTVTDPYLHSLKLTFANEDWYLQTSPEYAMKRLIAAGSGPIFQICKAFRADETGRLHNPEFTMLEWYRPGFNHHDLMDEMDALLQNVLHCDVAMRVSYADLFARHFDVNPHTVGVENLVQIAEAHALQIVGDHLDKDDWLQLLMSHLIEPDLGKSSPAFVYDFPATQAALAKVRQSDMPVAERFEVYLEGVELANGFHELNNKAEQKKRFEKDLAKRAVNHSGQVPMDHRLLEALDYMPDCAGVALGIDRLVMIALQKNQLADVMSFTCERV